MTAAAPSSAGPCTVSITASATAVAVLVDGKQRGRAPITLELPCEPTSVSFKHPRYVDLTKRVTPTADGAKLHASMDRPKALIKVVSKPAGAAVTLNGRSIGKTPLVRKIDAFESVTIVMKSSGMKPERRLVYPKRGTTVVAATLKKKR